jgi:hypothetical protein
MRQPNVIDCVQVRDEIKTLKYAANIIRTKLIALPQGHLIHARAQNRNITTRATQKAAQKAQQRGFTGA